MASATLRTYLIFYRNQTFPRNDSRDRTFWEKEKVSRILLWPENPSEWFPSLPAVLSERSLIVFPHIKLYQRQAPSKSLIHSDDTIIGPGHQETRTRGPASPRGESGCSIYLFIPSEITIPFPVVLAHPAPLTRPASPRVETSY